MIQTSPGLGNGGGIGKHAHGTLHFSQVTSGNNGRWLVVDTDLEASRAPVHKLDGTLGLDGGNGGVHILGYDVPSVKHAAGHVLSVAGIALDHLVGWLEAGIGDLGHTQLLVVRLLGRDDGRVGDKGEVDTWVRDQVGLELSQVNVQCSVKTQGGSDGGNNLTDETVQVGVGGALNVQVATADVIDGLVVDHEGAVRVLQCGVGGEDGVVGLHHRR